MSWNPAVSIHGAPRSRRARLLAVTAPVAMALLLGACGGSAKQTAGPGEQPPASDAVVTRPPDDTSATPTVSYRSEVIQTPSTVTIAPGYSGYEPGKTVVATLLAGETDLEVYDTATATTAAQTLQRDKEHPLVLVAVGTTPDRLYVQLPVRPNGSMGWIDKTKVTLASHDYKLIVELTAHRLIAMNGTSTLLEAPIGVGKGQTPTPDGVYYITELLKPPTPDSVYGSYAYGLSGFSEVLKSFGGGDGQVGIHGTNDPSTIGKDVSHGCIRLNNADIETLVKQLPLGTPVEVRA